jgi:hypothetical protein
MVFDEQIYQIGAPQPDGIVKRGGAQIVGAVYVGTGCDGLPRGVNVAGANGLAQFGISLKQEEAREDERQKRNRRIGPLLRV